MANLAATLVNRSRNNATQTNLAATQLLALGKAPSQRRVNNAPLQRAASQRRVNNAPLQRAASQRRTPLQRAASQRQTNSNNEFFNTKQNFRATLNNIPYDPRNIINRGLLKKLSNYSINASLGLAPNLNTNELKTIARNFINKNPSASANRLKKGMTTIGSNLASTYLLGFNSRRNSRSIQNLRNFSTLLANISKYKNQNTRTTVNNKRAAGERAGKLLIKLIRAYMSTNSKVNNKNKKTEFMNAFKKAASKNTFALVGTNGFGFAENSKAVANLRKISNTVMNLNKYRNNSPNFSNEVKKAEGKKTGQLISDIIDAYLDLEGPSTRKKFMGELKSVLIRGLPGKGIRMTLGRKSGIPQRAPAQ
jgi:hypothetical protein